MEFFFREKKPKKETPVIAIRAPPSDKFQSSVDYSRATRSDTNRRTRYRYRFDEWPTARRRRLISVETSTAAVAAVAAGEATTSAPGAADDHSVG